MIIVTTIGDGKKAFLNPLHIVAFYEEEDSTVVIMDNILPSGSRNLRVCETPEVIDKEIDQFYKPTYNPFQ